MFDDLDRDLIWNKEQKTNQNLEMILKPETNTDARADADADQ